MIDKRRLFFLTRQQIRDGWVRVYYQKCRRKKLKFTVRQWKKFDIEKQMWLTKIYEVILTNHMTRKERTIHILKKFNKKNFDSGIAELQKNINDFSKGFESIGMGSEKNMDFFTGKNKNSKDFLSL